MQIYNPSLFDSNRRKNPSLTELLLVSLLFASLGAITWAIRGSNGWNGIDGTLLPGLTWGLLWWFICWRKGIDARNVPLWLCLGLSFGGELGYGQYVSWIQGNFNHPDTYIDPWVGYLGFAICGIGWAAPGGIALGWILAGQKSLSVWLNRFVVPFGFAFLARLIVITQPSWFFPKWEEGYYVPIQPGKYDPTIILSNQFVMLGIWATTLLLSLVAWYVSSTKIPSNLSRALSIVLTGAIGGLLLYLAEWLLFPSVSQLGLFNGPLDKQPGRTVYTNTQNVIVVGWWLGALIVAAFQRDKFTLFAGLVLGIGFGIGFPLSAAWCHGYTYAPKLIDWWKMWELHSGVNLGLLYVIVLYWSIRQLEKPDAASQPEPITRYRQWCGTLAQGLGVFLAVHIFSRNDFLIVGLFLGAIYLIGIFTTAFFKTDILNRQGSFSFTYSVFLLIFMLTWGGTSMGGIILGLYDAHAVDQYSWPTGRMALMIPAGLLIVSLGLWKMSQAIHDPMKTLPALSDSHLVRNRFIELMAYTILIGTISIWPEKISVFYALFLLISLASFNRLNDRFDSPLT